MIVLSLCPLGFNNTSIVVIFLRWIGVPFMFAGFIMSLMLNDSPHLSYSARIIGSRLFQVVGYCSYPVCKSAMNTKFTITYRM